MIGAYHMGALFDPTFVSNGLAFRLAAAGTPNLSVGFCSTAVLRRPEAAPRRALLPRTKMHAGSIRCLRQVIVQTLLAEQRVDH